jgi:2-dehydro-3-deoxyglucarate aldolase/4-hydroxy-2-oxoheptanedioate aldolase
MATIKERVRNGEELLGVFLQMASPVAAELAGVAGFDWAVIDLEHGTGSESDVLGQLLALHGTGVPAVVRVESASRLRIGRALDLGAAGVLVPQVNDAAQAGDVARWLRYPPSGARGVALSARGAGYGAAGHGDVDRLDRAVLGIVQVETAAAIEQVEAIAATDGVDALFVGPSDLSHSLGVPGAFDAPAYTDALRRVVDAAGSHGRALGAYVSSVGDLERYRALGFTLLTIAADGLTALEGFRARLAAARASP